MSPTCSSLVRPSAGGKSSSARRSAERRRGSCAWSSPRASSSRSAAGALGLVLGRWIAGALVALTPAEVPRMTSAGIDWRVTAVHVPASPSPRACCSAARRRGLRCTCVSQQCSRKPHAEVPAWPDASGAPCRAVGSRHGPARRSGPPGGHVDRLDEFRSRASMSEGLVAVRLTSSSCELDDGAGSLGIRTTCFAAARGLFRSSPRSRRPTACRSNGASTRR